MASEYSGVFKRKQELLRVLACFHKNSENTC
jgi:hypothetical protein